MSAGELEKVLYVEDDLDIQLLAEMALETIGELTVLMCSSGQDAIDKAADFAPDLILLDVMMPHMDGPETLTNLRTISTLQTTPAVFMTAKVLPQDVERYKELGAVGVIEKPFDPMTLAEQVKTIWGQHHGQ